MPVAYARFQQSAPSLGVEVSSIDIRDAGDVDRALESVAREPNGGLIVTPGAPISDHRKVIFALANTESIACCLSLSILRGRGWPHVLWV